MAAAGEWLRKKSAVRNRDERELMTQVDLNQPLLGLTLLLQPVSCFTGLFISTRLAGPTGASCYRLFKIFNFFFFTRRNNEELNGEVLKAMKVMLNTPGNRNRL